MCHRRAPLFFSPGALLLSHSSRNSWYLQPVTITLWVPIIQQKYGPVDRVTFLEASGVWVGGGRANDWKEREREREGVNYSYVMVYTHNLYI